MTTRALNMQTGYLQERLINQLCHLPSKNHSNKRDQAFQLHGWFGIKSRKLMLRCDQCKFPLCTNFLHPFQTVHDPDNFKICFLMCMHNDKVY